MKKVSLFLTFSIIFYSCKKDLIIVEGCTDPVAVNWTASATYDNGSCLYDSNYVYQPTPYIINTPYGFPDMIIPSDNPLTIEGVDSGARTTIPVEITKDVIATSNTQGVTGVTLT